MFGQALVFTDVMLMTFGQDDDLMKFKKRSLAKTFKNTSFRLFALQPSTGKMMKR